MGVRRAEEDIQRPRIRECTDCEETLTTDYDFIQPFFIIADKDKSIGRLYCYSCVDADKVHESYQYDIVLPWK